MTELSIGEFKKSEFAEWFGISQNTLRSGHNSKKYWDILSLYAKYKMTYHTIIIEEVYGDGRYVNKNNKENFLRGNLKQYIRDHFDDILNGKQIIDNFQEVAREYYEKNPLLAEYVSKTYFARVFSEVKRELYGTVTGQKGEIGCSKYICCVLDEGEWRPLLKEETQVNSKIQQKKVKYAKIPSIEVFAFIQEHKDDEDLSKKLYEKYPIEEILEYEGQSSNKIYKDLSGKPLKRCTLLKKRDDFTIPLRGTGEEENLF